jgi:hypothetical protein
MCYDPTWVVERRLYRHDCDHSLENGLELAERVLFNHHILKEFTNQALNWK